MNVEDLLCIASSRNQGVSKSEFFSLCIIFDCKLTEADWGRFKYRCSRNSSTFYLENKRWYCFESSYYRSLVNCIHEEPENNHFGMAMGGCPYWIQECKPLFISIFDKKDFN